MNLVGGDARAEWRAHWPVVLAACSGVATGSPALAKGAESGVATVPGWMATRIACGWVRASSIAALRRIWFSAALLAR